MVRSKINAESKLKRKKGYFSISAVAKMFSVHQQTIRLYEKEGFITPKRSTGNTRLFSEEDVDRLEQIIYLTHELGINLAGVEMVLRLQKQIKKLQKEINTVFASAQHELSKDVEVYRKTGEEASRKLHALVSEKNTQKNSESGLLPSAVQKKTTKVVHQENQELEEDVSNNMGWEIEYEE